MVRTACINVYHYFLQILLRREKTWWNDACVVVTEDVPSGLVIDANGNARRLGVRPGMRFAAALSLAPFLRAGVVPPEEKKIADRTVLETLYTMTPEIEPCEFTPGVFRLDVGGINLMFSSPEAWAEKCRESVTNVGFRCRVALGSTRVATYIAAQTRRDVTIFPSRESETATVDAAPIAVLPVEPRVRERLTALGVRTVAAFCALPAGGVRMRFGEQTAAVYSFLADERDVPIKTYEPERESRYELGCAFVVRNRELLEPYFDRLLERLRLDLERAAETVTRLEMSLITEDGGVLREDVKPARPSRDISFLTKLLRLRLESVEIGTGVVRCALKAETAPVTMHQGQLFRERPRRDRAGAVAAISLLRARFGNDCVGRFVPRDEHLPDESAVWERLERPPDPGSPPDTACAPSTTRRAPLVRRIFAEPVPLASSVLRVGEFNDQTRDDGMRDDGTCPRVGPYIVSGRWWADEYLREYYYLETLDGRVLWVFHDGIRDRWMLQGFLE
ncbi:MAG: DNA polymerase Y family protein [Spirochaetaceae bacterium]|nr:MAG: DNA polymerase Y family protein [Spirochaetaceae bacterium]